MDQLGIDIKIEVSLIDSHRRTILTAGSDSAGSDLGEADAAQLAAFYRRRAVQHLETPRGTQRVLGASRGRSRSREMSITVLIDEGIHS